MSKVYTMTFEKVFEYGDYARWDKRLHMGASMEQIDEVKEYAKSKKWNFIGGFEEPVAEYTAEEIAKRDYKPLFD